MPAAPATGAGLLLAVLMLYSECLLSMDRESGFATQEGHMMQGLPKVEATLSLEFAALVDRGSSSTLFQGLNACAEETSPTYLA